MKNKQKGFIGVGILMVFVLIIGGVFIYKVNKESKVTETQVQTETNIKGSTQSDYTPVQTSPETSVSSHTTTLVQISYPSTGDKLKAGDTVHIVWNTSPEVEISYPSGFDAVRIQLIANSNQKCSVYTLGAVVEECTAQEIYYGSNSGSFDWKVSENVKSGSYIMKIFPDLGMSLTQEVKAKGFKLDGYSEVFTISGK
jgi:hypothetical protein